MGTIITLLGNIGIIITLLGVHNLIMYVSAFCIIKLFIRKKVKSKVLMLILGIILSFNLYSILSINGNTRLTVACSGHPIVAYTTDKNRIKIQKQNEYTYDIDFMSEKKDKDGFKITPLTIRLYKIGIIFSHYIGNG